MNDLRSALRTFRAAPVFTLVIVATLALCIGANSAIFSVVNAILLKPYPWPGSERLVYVHNTFPKLGGSAGGISIPDYLDHHAGVKAFAESALISGFSANLALEGKPERVYGLGATPSLFALLQTPPALGRAFTEADAEFGAPKTVVLREDFWRARFAGDPRLIGQSIRLNGEPYTVVGVMPRGFYFPSARAQFWVPLQFSPQQKSEAERMTQYSTMLARLRPEATLAQAQQEVDAIHRATRERLPDLKGEYEATGYGSVVLDFLGANVEDIRAMLWLLQAGVAAALLIGCANVANLLLARATARQREFAIRTALGAGRGRLIRQLLVEAIVLFLLGGGAGVLVAWWGLDAVDALGVASLPRGFGVALDLRVFAFTFLSAALTGVAFGALPAFFATRGHAIEALKCAGARTTASRHQLSVRGALAVAQIALSLMLLATSGLLLRSFARVQDESPGFVSDHVLTASLSLPPAKYSTPEKRAAFAAALTERLEALPGVTAAGVTSALPFGPANPRGGYEVEGFDPGPGKPNPNAMIRQVSPGYFHAMGIPLLRGRLLAAGDTLGRENAVVVDRYFADRYFPSGDPIGKHVTRGANATQGTGTWTIVGVVGTVKHWDLEEPVDRETLYFPVAQATVQNLALIVKTRAAPLTLASAIRQAVLAVDPEQPLFDVKTMEGRIDESLQRRRAPMLLLSVFAGVAVLLAALGIYGVLAFSVGQRANEIGVRMALGAGRPAILRLILGQGLVLVGCGLAIGLGGYFALSRFVQSLLYQIAPTDPVTLLAAPALLAVIALVACLLPARRATKVDPMTALRAE